MELVRTKGLFSLTPPAPLSRPPPPTRPLCCPVPQEVMELVRTKGLFSFYDDGHQECCRVRKVRALEAP